jgi:hypothetical protein
MKTKAVANNGGAAKAEPAQGVRKLDPANLDPTPEEIRERAYEIHIERGGIHGCDLDDWLQAERELKQKCADN